MSTRTERGVVMFAVTNPERSWFWNISSHRASTVEAWEKEYGDTWKESKKRGYRAVRVVVKVSP
jgi:hypothetical protein